MQFAIDLSGLSNAIGSTALLKRRNYVGFSSSGFGDSGEEAVHLDRVKLRGG